LSHAKCLLADGEMEMEDLELTPNHMGEQGVDADLQTQSI